MEEERSAYMERMTQLDSAIYEDLAERNSARRKKFGTNDNNTDEVGINDTSDALALLANKWIAKASKKKQEYDRYTKYTRKLTR